MKMYKAILIRRREGDYAFSVVLLKIFREFVTVVFRVVRIYGEFVEIVLEFSNG